MQQDIGADIVADMSYRRDNVTHSSQSQQQPGDESERRTTESASTKGNWERQLSGTTKRSWVFKS